MSFKDHFSSHAAAYANYRPGYPPALAAWCAELTPAKELALDTGCGSGQFSLLLAEHFERVIATDPSSQQIANAIPHPRIDYRTAPAEASGLEERSVDLISAAQAAHWFDLPAFFAEAKRILKPGGVLVLISYAGMEKNGPIETLIERFRLETLRGDWPPERALVERGYGDIALPFAPIETPEFFIEVEWSAEALIGYLDTWSAVRALERRGGRDQFDTVAMDIRALWGSASVRRFRWKLTLLAGRA